MPEVSVIIPVYRTEEYLVETVQECDAIRLTERFFGCRREGCLVVLRGEENLVFDVMYFVAEQRIPVIKVERMEPSLETLFMEVADR